MRIVPFEPSMKNDVCNLIISIQRDEFGVLSQGVPIQITDQPDLLALPDSYMSGQGGFWVAVADDDRVVGTIGFLDAGHATVGLRKMFVHPDFRGKKYGTGQALMDTALAHARAKGIKRILLGTLDRYEAAIRFYQRNGFTEIAEKDLPSYYPRMPVDTKFFDLEVQ